MNRFVMLAVGGCISLCMAATVSAAAEGAPHPPKQQGIVNAKKAMQGRFELDKKIQEVRKQGQTMKKQAKHGV